MILNLNIKPPVKNKSLSEINAEKQRVFRKVECIIKSCKIFDQLRVAENVVNLYQNKYPYPPAFGRMLMTEIDLRETIIRVKKTIEG